MFWYIELTYFQKRERMGEMRISGLGFQAKGQTYPGLLMGDYIWHSRRTLVVTNRIKRGCGWGVGANLVKWEEKGN